MLASLLSADDHPITLLANTAAFIFDSFERVNWVGFYLYDGKKLILGPFCGKPACTEIPIGSGVCGTAASTGETIVVPDVNAFPGHIVCDSASRSEIVVPLVTRNNTLIGVLDIDSPEVGRFTTDDAAEIGHLVTILSNKLGDRHLTM